MNRFYFFIAIINTLDLVGIIAAKLFSTNKNPWLLLLTVFCFGGAGFFFARSLRYEGAAITNVLWIAISVILVTILGYFIFKENITPIQLIGIFVILLGLILVNWR